MKTKLRGCKKIFAFAYCQTMKSRAMKITMAVLCGVALALFPIITLISEVGQAEENNTEGNSNLCNIEKVYYYDNTGICGIQFADKSIQSEMYDNIVYEETDKNDKEYIESLINADGSENDVFLSIEYCDDEESIDYGINVYVYYSEDADSSDNADAFAEFVGENIQKAILLSAGADEEAVNLAARGIDYEVIALDSEGMAEDDIVNEYQYFVSLTVICLLIFAVSVTGSKVSELIVTEKSTRVMEYILTSVKPMAVLVGKVLASVLAMLTMLVAAAISLGVSILINSALFPSDDGSLKLPNALTGIIENGQMTGITPANILLAVIIIILGTIFYGCVAGIAGASVSKIEEMAEGMKLFTFTMMIGAYLPLFMLILSEMGQGVGVLEYVIILLPISSMFIVPEYLMFGRLSQAVALGAAGILVLSVILVLMLASRVYENMLYNNGAALKPKDIIRLAKRG